MALASALGGKAPVRFPFGHIYQITSVECPLSQSEAPHGTSTVYLTADSRLLLEARDRSSFTDAGKLEPEGDRWSAQPKGQANQRYRVWVEEGDSVKMSFTRSGEEWIYTLSRVDTLLCDVSAGGKSQTLQPEWFADGVYDSGDYALLATDVDGEGILTLRMEGGPQTLEVREDYHAGEDVDSRVHTLTADSGGAFSLPIAAVTAKNNEFAVYRIAYQGGEYLFQIHFR